MGGVHLAGRAPRYVFELKYGQDGPAIVFVHAAEDVFDYYPGFGKRNEAQSGDAKWAEIEKAFDDCSRSVEVVHLTLQPELSNLR